MPAHHLKYYRVAAEPYAEPSPDADVFTRMQHADRAERQLREHLAAGHTPAVLLVASERAVPAEIEPGGQLSHVFAWAPDAAGTQFTSWSTRHHVRAELEVQGTLTTADPYSSDYAADGSVHLAHARIHRLVLAPWLAPVAGQLAERYGVPVDQATEPELPAVDARPAPAVLIRQALPDDVIADLVDLFERTAEYPDLDGYRPPRQHAALPWDDWGPLISELLHIVGEAYGLPVNYATASVMSYTPGDQFEQHTDRVSEVPSTWDRTVSLSLLLNQPGQDFAGGQLEINCQPVELEAGDLLGFTAATPHAVRPITTGRRLVLVAFGEYRR
ncbi:2OG-Fe(II) oxygenase [Kribbella sp. NPDC051137]|uniref:2OG-Fe(II) oxygenase n=1 Tax=Kribbella sp. NPDC051137 TaxID=3155045 RepID=UPI003414B681